MYGFNIMLQDSFDNTVKRVTEALKTEGFDARLSRCASCYARKSRAAIPGGPLGGKTVHRTVFSSASPLARTPSGRAEARPILLPAELWRFNRY